MFTIEQVIGLDNASRTHDMPSEPLTRLGFVAAQALSQSPLLMNGAQPVEHLGVCCAFCKLGYV